jgi:hypothetical protein
MGDKKENKEPLDFCRETCSKSMKLLIGNLLAEGVPKEKLARALKKTEAGLETIISTIHHECINSKQKAAQNKNFELMRKDYLTRILVHYLKENDSLVNAVNFPRQSFKIFAEAIRKLLGELIIEEKQLQCQAVVNDYKDGNGQVDWDRVYVDDRAKQICWDVLFRISMAISGLTGEWFKEYITDYAKMHGSFHGEGMAHYVKERLESIAKMFRLDR